MDRAVQLVKLLKYLIFGGIIPMVTGNKCPAQDFSWNFANIHSSLMINKSPRGYFPNLPNQI